MRARLTRRHRRLLTLSAGDVYIIGSRVNGWYKIGRSTDARTRRRALQNGFPFTLETIATVRTRFSLGIEQRLHKQFAKERMHGEWFAFSNERLAVAVEALHQLNTECEANLQEFYASRNMAVPAILSKF